MAGAHLHDARVTPKLKNPSAEELWPANKVGWIDIYFAEIIPVHPILGNLGREGVLQLVRMISSETRHSRGSKSADIGDPEDVASSADPLYRTDNIQGKHLQFLILLRVGGT